MKQKCALERQILQNALSLVSIVSNEMAYRIMKMPDYTPIPVTTVEIIHLIKCRAVECKIRHIEGCFYLPVSYCNASHFLLLRSRIIQKVTPREYSEVLSIMYITLGTRLPIKKKDVPPPVIQPLIHPIWTYVRIL